MEVQFAVSKISKWASRESGDTLEMIERPHGGLSMVLVDGQTSGRSAKAISNVVARKAIQLLAEGVRDGAAARAAHDYLYTFRGGKVSATLNILSVDTHTRTIVIGRNNEAPVLVHTAADGFYLLDSESKAVGVHRNTKPVIAEIPIEIGTIVVAYTDGLRHAGSLSGKGRSYDPYAALQEMVGNGIRDARAICDRLLAAAMAMDDGRPRDDISVIAIVVEDSQEGDDVRRQSGRLTL
ncbi:MAG: serine/threonine-protein phosphatase [Candidatus Promineofilum sp.]|nr:serine/threonine-protein phosphatase [Promineifilum sp.]